MSAPMDPRAEGDLSPRDVQVLQAIIQDHIATAGPVGSKALARGHGLEVSPATVRNVMADLEHLGYLHKPHTSAGRVPTEKAFRFYVDRLLRVGPLPRRDRAAVDRGYEPRPEDLPSLMQQTGRILHRLTHHAAVVAAPRLSQAVLRQLTFVRLRENRVLAVLVGDAGLVQNRVLLLDAPLSPGEIEGINRYLEELLGEGGTFGELRAAIERARAEERAAYDLLCAEALELSRRALEEAEEGPEARVLVEGQASFLDAPEFADRGKVRALLDALDEKERILRILERAEGSPGIQIFVGSDSELGEAEDVAAVIASYRRGERVLGTLGVIGPTRMDYSRVVPYVAYTASLLGRVFEEELG